MRCQISFVSASPQPVSQLHMAIFSFFPSLHFFIPKFPFSLDSGTVLHTLLNCCAASDAFFPPRRKGGSKTCICRASVSPSTPVVLCDSHKIPCSPGDQMEKGTETTLHSEGDLSLVFLQETTPRQWVLLLTSSLKGKLGGAHAPSSPTAALMQKAKDKCLSPTLQVGWNGSGKGEKNFPSTTGRVETNTGLGIPRSSCSPREMTHMLGKGKMNSIRHPLALADGVLRWPLSVVISAEGEASRNSWKGPQVFWSLDCL